jgi:5-methylcytosine-specific restriction endonuclease McrBC regulatory subunit McrC
MSKLLLNRYFPEHYGLRECDKETINDCRLQNLSKPIEIKIGEQKIFAEITSDNQLKTNYYIGIYWLIKNELAIYIAPKLNTDTQQTDYLKMLFSCLKHSDIAGYTKNLYEIKFDEPFIEIEQKQDMITPLLIVQFLQLLKIIVHKGLKKSYYRIEQNLYGKIKGKVLVSQTLKQNILKNKLLKTFCQHDEFGVNSPENKVLKKTLIFVQKYLAFFPDQFKAVESIIDYCQAAFQEVGECKDLNELKNVKIDSFFKEYKEGLHISSLILRRFGYNIKNIDKNEYKIKVPPFWIDMSKLFELYVLSLLKDKYNNHVKYQTQGTYGQPDFILTIENKKTIIDTKYKTKWKIDFNKLPEDDRHNLVKDIRQLSGYARDTKILEKLGCKAIDEQNVIIDCLIIYPDTDPLTSKELLDNIKTHPIKGFFKFYKMPIRLPQIQ